ncbi:uncharacterized protein LOC131803094 [Musca domestica]|uniref:Uncharacterized protein LOC131803094 n=1 Tax=Musca domestica TaxID=7370 RepID=A0ABM3V2S9_MUSDO|nr:uncharacterized protein LOC131803094 [Musca domestica]XP_061393755.1 uncharacterized protein LOC133329281 [Musca vetustissima]
MKFHNRRTSVSTKCKFACRVCRQRHALKSCSRFHDLNTLDRMRVVKKYGYCMNCLAHTHSQGTCFTKTGCRYCGKAHHSLLHTHSRLRKASSREAERRVTDDRHIRQATNSTSSQAVQSLSGSSTSGRDSRIAPITPTTASLTSLLNHNMVTLLPTILVRVENKGKNHQARCLLDSAARMSYVSQRLLDKLGVVCLELDKETICPLTLWATAELSRSIDVTLRVNHRIGTLTPKKSLPDSIKEHFANFILADKFFNVSAPIDIVLGVDVYARIVLDGMYAKPGLPTAQSTLFGIVLYGTFNH